MVRIFELKSLKVLLNYKFFLKVAARPQNLNAQADVSQRGGQNMNAQSNVGQSGYGGGYGGGSQAGAFGGGAFGAAQAGGQALAASGPAYYYPAPEPVAAPVPVYDVYGGTALAQSGGAQSAAIGDFAAGQAGDSQALASGGYGYATGFGGLGAAQSGGAQALASGFPGTDFWSTALSQAAAPFGGAQSKFI